MNVTGISLTQGDSQVGCGSAFKAVARRRGSHRGAGRACLLSFVLSAISIQAFLGWAENRWPELRDVEYRYKLQRLQSQIAANPEQPLVLLLGSSRTLYGLRPDLISPVSVEGSANPLIFNFGMPGAGPIKQSMYLQRLLDAGVRPRAVMIEVLPVLLNQVPGFGEESWLRKDELHLLTLRDIDRASSLLREGEAMRKDWWSEFHRHEYAWRWVPRDSTRIRWKIVDAAGWMTGPNEVTDADRQRLTATTHREFAKPLEGFSITPLAERALRDLLELCQSQSIQFSLYLMPEGPEFCSWYGSQSRSAIDDFLAKISREYRCEVHDATYWASEDQFVDSHHLLSHGAEAVSRRFAEQAVGPFLTNASRAGASDEQLSRRASSEQVR